MYDIQDTFKQIVCSSQLLKVFENKTSSYKTLSNVLTGNCLLFTLTLLALESNIHLNHR